MSFPNHIINYLTDKEINVNAYDSFFKENEHAGFRTFFLKTFSSCLEKTRNVSNSLDLLINMSFFKDDKVFLEVKKRYDSNYKRLSIIFEELKTDQLKESMEFFVKDTIKYLNKLQYINRKLGSNYVIVIKKIVKAHFDLEKKEMHDELFKADESVDSNSDSELLKKRFNEHFVSLYLKRRKELKEVVDPFLASIPDILGEHSKTNYIKGFHSLLEKVRSEFESYDYYSAYIHIKDLRSNDKENE